MFDGEVVGLQPAAVSARVVTASYNSQLTSSPVVKNENLVGEFSLVSTALESGETAVRCFYDHLH